MRIAIVHRDRLYRESVARCLAQVETISVVHSASGLEEGRGAIVACRPDLLILDFGLSRRRGAADTGEGYALSLGIKTIVIGVPDKEEDILACIEGEGAAGYLLQDASLDDLVSNINAVMRGEALCSPRIASLAFGRMSTLARQTGVSRPSMTSNGTCLTRREAEIVRLIDDGLSNKEIAVRLHIEVSTVKNHIHNILDKLQLHNRYSAVKYIKGQDVPTSSV